MSERNMKEKIEKERESKEKTLKKRDKKKVNEREEWKRWKKKNIKKDDLVLAIPSSGVHSNGYSLVRHVLKNKKINLKNNLFLKSSLINLI